MTVKEREDVRLERSLKDIWTQVQEALAQRLKQPTFQTWIRPTTLVDLIGDEAVVAVNNEFMRRWIVESQHLETITQAISQVLKRRITVRIIVDPDLKHEFYTPSIASITVYPEAPAEPVEEFRRPGAQAPVRSEAGPGRSTAAGLNQKYLFGTFVVGSHNRFSHSAALAVAERPGQAYNPLFLYGGVGLGKTHMLHAIGHKVLEHSPHLAVRYISCERFTNELINSIRDDRMIEFRKRYRQVDVLLMDDIQFIEGKESTQEEFFHTFNALRDSGRQIVISSDRPPKALSLLEERLRSRFEWGLITDIQAPDFETRTAILRKKCELDNMLVPGEVIEYIATLFTTNIRELEGALIRAHAYTSLTGAPLSVAALAGILKPAGVYQVRPALTVDAVIAAVSAHFKVEPGELRSQRRAHDLALPRHLAMYLAHEHMQMSFPRIGQAFGNRKHTSALYAYNRIKAAILKDPELAQTVRRISEQLSC